MLKPLYTASLLLLVLIVLAHGPAAFAHIGAASIEQLIDGRLVDIGYSPEEPRADEQTRLDFAILEPDTLEEQPFTDVWVRIKDDNDRLLFAGGLNKAEFGLTGITYMFAKPGEYEVFVRFSDDGTTIVEATASITIGEAVSRSWTFSGVSELISFATGALLAFGVAWLATRRAKFRRGGPRLPETVSVAESKPRSAFLSRIPIIPLLIGLACSILAFYVTKMVLDGEILTESDPIPQVATQTRQASMVLTNRGFEPAALVIKKGSTVVFSTDAGRPFWPASNVHPTHEEYPAFDPGEPIPPEETWSFTFDQVGKWQMHDHLRSYFTGSIEVVE